MENLQQALDLLEQGYYMTKVDLKNAYYSIPITQEHQPWKDKVWMFTRLCFGLSPAPRIFTKVMKPLLANMRSLVAKIIAYIDDLWLANRDNNRCRQLTFRLITLLEELGFTVNREKSVTEPVQYITFLGMDICSTNMTVSLPAPKTV